MSLVLIKCAAALFTAGLLGFTFFAIKAMERKNREFRTYDTVDRNTAYLCPRCGQAMDNGFAVAGRGISFRRDGEKPAGPFILAGSMLENTVNMTFSNRENRAFRCQACRYVLIDHSCLIGPGGDSTRNHPEIH